MTEARQSVASSDFDRQARCHSREGTRSFVTTLVDVSSSSVVRPKHGYDTVRVSVGSGDIRALGSDVVNVETDSTGSLGDHGAGLEGVVDSLDRVVLHGDQEARGELRVGSTGVEELVVEHTTTLAY